MRITRSFWAALSSACALATTTGCPPIEIADGGAVCEPGATQACVCPSGSNGSQRCDPSAAVWLGCVCAGDVDAAVADRAPIDRGTHDAVPHDARTNDGGLVDGAADDVNAIDSSVVDSAVADGSAIDSTAPDAAAEDSGPIDECAGLLDQTECASGVGLCFAGICRLPDGCSEAWCNRGGPRFMLADTSQRDCFSNPVAPVCPSQGQDWFGQDAQYGWDTGHGADQRFARSWPVASQPVVDDVATGLQWQGCPAGLDGAECELGVVQLDTWLDADLYCATLSWGGHDDWALPDDYELQSIVDYGRVAPAIDSATFPHTPEDFFLARSAHAFDSSHVWYVDFLAGAMASTTRDSGTGHVRCVRPTSGSMGALRQLYRSEPVSGEPVVDDSATGLTWQGCAAGLAGSDCSTGNSATATWLQALSYCETLTYAGAVDWRLPDIDELRSLVDNRRALPALDALRFPETPADNFWSSTTYVDSPTYAWLVSFDYGFAGGYGKSRSFYVRCVR